MATTTISPKFQIVIPKDVREKLHLRPQQRLQVVEKGESSPWCRKCRSRV